MHLIKVLFIALFFHVTFQANSQHDLFDHPEAMNLVSKGTEKIYQLDMDSALYYIRKLNKLIPNHPVIPSMEAFLIQWENIPIIEGQTFVRFEAKLREAIAAAENFNPLDPYDEEAVFFELATRGLLAEHYAENNKYFDAINEANKMYGLIKKGFDLVDDNPEFLFTTGLYNYFRTMYPERHPIFAPVAIFFKKGDKELGLEQMVMSTEKAIISQIEAAVYLSYIYLRYEQTPEKAFILLQGLIKKYPNNSYLLSKFLEAAYATRQYNQIMPWIVDALINTNKMYYKMIGYIFRATYLEFVEKETKEAYIYYGMGVGFGNEILNHGEYFKSVGYLGLGRLSQQFGNVNTAKSYYNLCLKYAETEDIEKAAHLGLNP
ncbi:MAG: hypothetical protein P8N26_05230 [Cyclobacteriaceae bacterium]|nr:hypothetical protein [Cyclobacteriaceae bacterium]